jgi:hypothetical protein
VRPLAIGVCVIALAGLAAGVIVMTHPFGRQKLADASAVSAARRTIASRPAASPSAPPTGAPTGAASSPVPSPSGASPLASPFTQQQAAVNLAALLTQSASDRQAVNTAYNDVIQCGPNMTNDAQTFQAAATSHRQLLNELARLPGRSALPPTMTQDLSTAWQASISADDDFAQWAQDQVTGGCSAASLSDPSYAAADEPDVQATNSKTAFVQLWNPLAQAYGMQTYAQSDL